MLQASHFFRDESLTFYISPVFYLRLLYYLFVDIVFMNEAIQVGEYGRQSFDTDTVSQQDVVKFTPLFERIRAYGLQVTVDFLFSDTSLADKIN